ncbi:hypothetical protein H920_15279 [Fukomys damarensis]|uniref:Uncharacterized protein n=1 Tax=Fukomys damarensis TaxID=885580 RepID=A0A091CYQ6_FUKDA|nr:hypothetical protein H920_15279 [Fukomys damarensis]
MEMDHQGPGTEKKKESILESWGSISEGLGPSSRGCSEKPAGLGSRAELQMLDVLGRRPQARKLSGSTGPTQQLLMSPSDGAPGTTLGYGILAPRGPASRHCVHTEASDDISPSTYSSSLSGHQPRAAPAMEGGTNLKA